MDLASGYSDSINYGNGYTPLANNAIANNNSEYARNQAAIALMAQQAQNNVFASGGGFGQQTADYAGAGAAYGRAVGGGGNIYAAPGGGSGGGGGQSVFETGTDPYQDWLKTGGYTQQPGGIGSDAARAPNQPGNAPIPWFWQGIRDLTGMTSGAPSYEAPAPTPQAYGPGYFDNTFGSAYANQQKAINSRPVDWDKTFNTITAPYAPQTYSGGGIGSDAVRDPYQDWLKGGGYQQPQPQQSNSLPPFWQGIRDIFGADPKDQSRVPQSDGGYPGFTNPNYQPGGMTPQQPVPFRDTWTNAS